MEESIHHVVTVAMWFRSLTPAKVNVEIIVCFVAIRRCGCCYVGYFHIGSSSPVVFASLIIIVYSSLESSR